MLKHYLKSKLHSWAEVEAAEEVMRVLGITANEVIFIINAVRILPKVNPENAAKSFEKIIKCLNENK